jgi:hypothetical protein
MAQAQRKVVVRSKGGLLTWGYLPSRGFLLDGRAELMGVDGRVISLFMSEIKTIAYVRDFNLTDSADPERMGRMTFSGRPRSGGLWLRLWFAEDDVVEGVAEFDLAAVDALADDGGLSISPPDGRGNTLRLFVPRTALIRVETLGWISSAAKVKPAKPKKAIEGQGGLFEPEPDGY